MEQMLQSRFSKGLLTGVFAGFAATVICLIYNAWYRGSSGFQLSGIINVSSLIFAINTVFLFIGVLYGFINTLKKGDILFVILFLLIIVFCIWKTEGVQRTDNQQLNTEFRQLLLGVVLITGIAVLSIPVLFHSKKFEEHVI